MGFGDKDLATGDINDLVVTDNKDSQKVLATVAFTVYTFTNLINIFSLKPYKKNAKALNVQAQLNGIERSRTGPMAAKAETKLSK